MSPRSGSHLNQLAAHDEVIVAAKQRLRAVELEQRAVAERIAAKTEQIVEAHAQGDDEAAAKLRRERGKLKNDTASQEKVTGAQRALARAEAERAVFVRTNLNALLAELKPQADAAVLRLRGAIEAIFAAHAEWGAQEQRVMKLLQSAGQSTGDVARLPDDVERLVREANRVDAGEISAPFPARNGGLRVVPEDDPDPGIREAARAKLRAA